MTRSKKTRSLKRIHQVKTGSKQKLKRAADTDRQGRKLKKPTLSVYEKYLLEQEKKAASTDTTSKSEIKKSKKAVTDNSNPKPNFKQTSKAAVKQDKKIETPVIDERHQDKEESDIFAAFSQTSKTDIF